jgi:phosphoglycolate phosphatase-like HAD superfamily hydrolase
MLILFDVDGTLFLTDDPLVGEATAEAAREVWGVELPPDCLARLDLPGALALRQARELLRRAGVTGRQIDAGLPRWCALHAKLYVERLPAADTSAWRPAEGAWDTLAELEGRDRLALVTGNAEPIARARMERLGLDRFFPPGQGAFGCEAEERPRLIELARQRAGGWPAAETVAVGDTPEDVAGARAAGIHVVAVVSPRYDADAFADADGVISSLGSLPGALSALRR